MNKLEARVDKLETEYRSKNGSQQQEEISPIIREAIEKLHNLKIGDEGTPEAEEWERRREERIRNWQPGEYGLLLLERGVSRGVAMFIEKLESERRGVNINENA